MTNNGQNNAYLKPPRNRFWLGLHFDRPLQFGKSAQNRKRQRFWQGSFSRKNIKSLLKFFWITLYTISWTDCVFFSVSSLTIFFFLQRSFTGRFLQGLGCVPVQLILNAAIFPFIIPRIATLGLFTKAYTIVTSQARKIQLLSRNS